ncbi:MAG: PDDEXK nuclease domain-containing protein [Chloroflexota bacterium]
MNPIERPSADELINDVRQLIEETRLAVASTVNSGLTMLYWRIGKRINSDILRYERAPYGKQIIVTLAHQLTLEYGKGFSEKSLRRMMQFATFFPNEEIVVSLVRQLSWTHFLALLPLKDELQRDFYAQLCRIEGWSTRTLRQKIDSMLYERTALSRKPEALIRQELETLRQEEQLTPDLVFRDPYILDFLGLRDQYLERDLEEAILHEIEAFLMELGDGFTFVARQKRISVDHDDYYLDLLLFHRGLRRLVAIELKLNDFKPADKGQMELYLRWLEKYEMKPGEEVPIGLILCAGKNEETVELLGVEKSGIRVAEYLTKVLPKELLARKLHAAIQHARARLEQQSIAQDLNDSHDQLCPIVS